MSGITADHITAGYADDRWAGWGYLGERSRAHPERVAAADAVAVACANDAGLTPEEFFHWLNSKPGRWFGDEAFGCNEFDAAEVALRCRSLFDRAAGFIPFD